MELKLTALDVETVAAILARSGGRTTADMVRTDIAAGAPVNPDGTINLIHYAAWLVTRLRQPALQSPAGEGGGYGGQEELSARGD